MFHCKAGLQLLLAVYIALDGSIYMKSLQCNFQIEFFFRSNNNNDGDDDDKISKLQNVTEGN